MPRISAIDTIQSRDLSEALEWFTGDATTLTGLIETDTDPPDRQDLTGAVMTLTVEFYHAEVIAGHGRNASLTLSGFVLDADRASKALTVEVDSDQATNPGRFTVTVPADLYDDPPPAADLELNVPVAICYLRKTQGGEIRTTRFVIVFRRGVPK